MRTTATASAPSGGESGPGTVALFTVLGALAVAVVLMAASVLSANTVEQRKAELAEVRAGQAETRLRVAELKPFADFRDLAQGRVATVRQLADSRFDWERALRDVSRALPADVSLETIGASLESAGSEGASPLRSAIQAPAIELAGCATDQRSVARTMARLRAVQGVTRVSLGESQKAGDQQEGAAVSETAPAGGTEDQPLCGPGDHPSFAIVIFFERDAALSAAPNVQSAAAGGAKGSGSAPSDSSSTPSEASGDTPSEPPSPTPSEASASTTPGSAG